MLANLNLTRRQQHLVISIDNSEVTIAYYKKSVFLWRKIRDGRITLSDPTQDLSELKNKLTEKTSSWDIPDETFVSWILPSDIVGALRIPTDKKSNLASFFPFELKDLRTSELDKESKKTQTLFWIHKDWTNELNNISKQLGWICIELFSRAQLFWYILPKISTKYGLLLEGDGTEKHLHIYSSTGSILRTTKLLINAETDFSALVRREINAICSEGEVEIDNFNFFAINSTLPIELATDIDFKFNLVPAVAVSTLMIKLLRSGMEGVEMTPTSDILLSRIKIGSLAITVIGTALLGAMVWHDGQLQSQLNDYRAQLRKETPLFQAAQLLRSETLKMSTAVRARQAIVKEPSSLKPLAEVLSMMNPPAALIFYAQNGESLKISGIQGDADNIKSLMDKNPNFYNTRIVDSPEFMKDKKQKFSLESMWRTPQTGIRNDTTQERGK